MVKESIYRNAGQIGWNDTVAKCKELFLTTMRQDCTVKITAPDKAMGKSTAFQVLAPSVPGIAIEGDILSVLAYTLCAEHKLNDDWTIGDLANGVAIPDFVPWTFNIEGDKDERFRKALSGFLGSDFLDKISLCTAFAGLKSDGTLVIIPDRKFYVKNFTARTEFMINDPNKPEEWKEHVKKKHVLLSETEFNASIVDSAVTRVKNSWNHPIVFVPNVNPESFDVMLKISLRTLLNAISATFATYLDVTTSWKL